MLTTRSLGHRGPLRLADGGRVDVGEVVAGEPGRLLCTHEVAVPVDRGLAQLVAGQGDLSAFAVRVLLETPAL
eukprot:5731076-Pyramimonas_sp.AAC.1